MLENEMKNYLGKNYSENSVKNFLTYWQQPSIPREENDLDCIYLNGDLNADTLISFWTPLKWALQILNPDEEFYKVTRTHDDPNYYLKKIENNLDRFLPPDDELTKLIYKLAALAETRANVISLPVRWINGSRYYHFYDEVPATLYNIFKDGRYYRCFGSDDAVCAWVKEQKLESAFYNNEIRRENIIPWFDNLPLYEAKWPETREEVTKALKEMIKLLEARYSAFDKAQTKAA